MSAAVSSARWMIGVPALVVALVSALWVARPGPSHLQCGHNECALTCPPEPAVVGQVIEVLKAQLDRCGPDHLRCPVCIGCPVPAPLVPCPSTALHSALCASVGSLFGLLAGLALGRFSSTRRPGVARVLRTQAGLTASAPAASVVQAVGDSVPAGLEVAVASPVRAAVTPASRRALALK